MKRRPAAGEGTKNLSLMTIMATSAYLSQGGPGAPSSDQEDGGVMNLVNTSASQGYTLPREQVVRTYSNMGRIIFSDHIT